MVILPFCIDLKNDWWVPPFGVSIRKDLGFGASMQHGFLCGSVLVPFYLAALPAAQF
jgi:hypothetical protein